MQNPTVHIFIFEIDGDGSPFTPSPFHTRCRLSAALLEGISSESSGLTNAVHIPVESVISRHPHNPMALASGTRLGPYEVLALIGAGGMGVVYRARDSKLNRDVALKILPDAFASDSDRLARFKREAQVLASLNHPNIAAIYGLEESNGVRALVLELVEGPTLADRIAHGPIPLDEALSIARQIAEALEAAHEQGIIHRDLKPANVLGAQRRCRLEQPADPAATRPLHTKT
jgi:serine/threonine protein kinase